MRSSKVTIVCKSSIELASNLSNVAKPVQFQLRRSRLKMIKNSGRFIQKGRVLDGFGLLSVNRRVWTWRYWVHMWGLMQPPARPTPIGRL